MYIFIKIQQGHSLKVRHHTPLPNYFTVHEQWTLNWQLSLISTARPQLKTALVAALPGTIRCEKCGRVYNIRFSYIVIQGNATTVM